MNSIRTRRTLSSRLLGWFKLQYLDWLLKSVERDRAHHEQELLGLPAQIKIDSLEIDRLRIAKMDCRNGTVTPVITTWPRARRNEAIAEQFTTVPVLMGFDSTQPIGELNIITQALLEHPNFVFGLGYQVHSDVVEAGAGPIEDRIGYKLECVGLVTDESYVGFLRKTGRIAA